MRKLFRGCWSIWLKIAGLHRSDDDTEMGTWVNFFFPRLRLGFFIRMAIVAVCAVIVFLFILIAKKYPTECLPDMIAYKVYIISILLAAF